MAIGLPNWWHSFVLLAILLGCSVQVRPLIAFALARAIEQLFPFGPLPPPPPPPPPPPLSHLQPEAAAPPPKPYSNYFNQSPPVPDIYALPSNHDRSAYMPDAYARIPYHPSPVNVPNEYRQSYPLALPSNPTDLYISPTVPQQTLYGLDETAAYDPYWEKSRPASPITTIIQHVLANYRSHESPDENNPDPTTVTVSIHILAVASINVVKMEYTVDLYLRQQWVDPRLAWYHVPHLAHYKNYVLLTAQKHQLWLPDLFFRNGKLGYQHDMSVPNDLIRVHPNGSILYSQKITMILSCSMYLRLYPMDHQECQMNIGSYGYTVDELKFVWSDENPVTVAENLQLLEFDSPRSASTRDCTKNGTTSTGTYSCLLLTLPLQRLVSSYLVTTYIPEVLIVMVSWLGFWIDVRAVPARISLGLLTLLGLLTEGSSVGSKLPRVTYIKAIDVWIIACLLFVVAALAEFAVAYMLAPRENNNEWDCELRQVIRDILRKKVGDARCCCCYTKCTNHKPVLVTQIGVDAPGGGVISGGGGGGGGNAAREDTEYRKELRDPNTSSSVTQCGLCESVQPSCCTCPLCIHLQCPKAPRSGTLQQRKTIKTNVTTKYPNVRVIAPSTTTTTNSKTAISSSATDRKHIVICEPSPTYRSQSTGLKRIGVSSSTSSTGTFPIKSALKVSQSHDQPRYPTERSSRFHRPYMPGQSKYSAAVSCSTEKRKQRLLFSSRSLFRFTRLQCGAQTSRSKRLPAARLGQHAAGLSSSSTLPANQTLDTYDSEVDAYSRFLFPACFVLFNCCYWLFYMIIVDDRPPEPS